MKHCSKCGEDKPLDEFHNNAARLDGKQSWCKTCMRATNLAEYKRNVQVPGTYRYNRAHYIGRPGLTKVMQMARARDRKQLAALEQLVREKGIR